MVRPTSTSADADARFVDIDGLRAYLVDPSGPGGPDGAATLLLPMITGIGSRVREFASSAAARTGQPVLVWDPWHGPSSDDTEFAGLQERHAQLTDDQAIAEQRILLGWLARERGVTAAGLVGWCLGGRFALVTGAREPSVRSVVAYHPTLPAEPPATHTVDAVAEAGRITAPVMVHYPGRDSLVPRDNFLRLQEALQGRECDAATIVHLYPHAKHGFSDSARHGEQVNADAWALSWPQTLSFLDSAARLPG